MLLIVLSTGMSGGIKEQGTEVIEGEDHFKVVIEKPEGRDLKVRYYVAVTEGTLLDILVMDESDYDDYLNADVFDYYPGSSKVNTDYIDKTFVYEDNEDLYLVVDNSEILTPPPEDPEEQNVTINYIIQWEEVEPPPSRSFWAYVFFGIVGLLLVIVIFRHMMHQD
jgi:hypothetical protein